MTPARKSTPARDPGAAGFTPRTALAIFLAWLVPGLGHVFLGRVRRGLFFGALVWSAFGLGLAHDGRLALHDSRQHYLTLFQVGANLGVGPADVLARVVCYGSPAYALPERQWNRPESKLHGLFRDRTRSALSIYGTAYLWTAGLMNLLLLFDVWDIGRKRREGAT